MNHLHCPLLASDLDPTTWTFPRQVIFNGATAGLVYGVLAVGIVLIYRSSRVINFAYGELAAFAATLMSRLVFHWGLDFFPSLLVVLAAGALLSAVIEFTVVRRLFDAPRVILFVATLGVTQLIILLELLLPGTPEPVRLSHPVHDAVHGGGDPRTRRAHSRVRRRTARHDRASRGSWPAPAMAGRSARPPRIPMPRPWRE